MKPFASTPTPNGVLSDVLSDTCPSARPRQGADSPRPPRRALSEEPRGSSRVGAMESLTESRREIDDQSRPLCRSDRQRWFAGGGGREGRRGEPRTAPRRLIAHPHDDDDDEGGSETETENEEEEEEGPARIPAHGLGERVDGGVSRRGFAARAPRRPPGFRRRGRNVARAVCSFTDPNGVLSDVGQFPRIAEPRIPFSPRSSGTKNTNKNRRRRTRTRRDGREGNVRASSIDDSPERRALAAAKRSRTSWRRRRRSNRRGKPRVRRRRAPPPPRRKPPSREGGRTRGRGRGRRGEKSGGRARLARGGGGAGRGVGKARWTTTRCGGDGSGRAGEAAQRERRRRRGARRRRRGSPP